MSHLAKDMTPEVTWRDITPGCNIFEGGTSRVVQTGDWRTMIFMIEYLPPSIAWGWCYKRSGSIWTVIFMHMIFNAMGMAVMRGL